MKLLLCALAALVVGCGKGSKSETTGSGAGSAAPPASPAADATSWKLGGLDVPVTFIPKTLGTLPTALPLKPGAPYRLSDFPDDPPNVEHKVIAGYAPGAAPHDDVIVGYDQLVKVDLLADLTKAWGAPAHETTAAGTSDCWPETNKVKTCWVRFGEQPVWHLQYTSSDVVAAAPDAPPAAKPTTTFTDQPLGKGACGLLGVKEASEILGVQLAYTEKGNDVCRYGAGDLELTVMERPEAEQELSHGTKVDGFADKAGWDFVDALVFILHGKGYRIAFLDTSRTPVQLRDATLQIGRKVLARLEKK
jgi:hypothetical protein